MALCAEWKLIACASDDEQQILWYSEAASNFYYNLDFRLLCIKSAIYILKGKAGKTWFQALLLTCFRLEAFTTWLFISLYAFHNVSQKEIIQSPTFGLYITGYINIYLVTHVLSPTTTAIALSGSQYLQQPLNTVEVCHSAFLSRSPHAALEKSRNCDE